MENKKIPIYVINLERRTERKVSILAEFADRSEFELTIYPAIEHIMGAMGLWQTIVQIIGIATQKDDDNVIVICEDDHEFTQHYSKQMLFDNIIGTAQQGVKILLCGISSFGQAIPVNEQRCWIDSFQCTQFTIVYRTLFQQILDEII